MKESLIQCPKCGSDACYTTPVNEKANSYFCFGCGFTTSDLQKLGEFDIEQFEEKIPELYKDVKHVDADSRVWYPGTINIPEKGTVFLNGTFVQTAQWSAIKVRELTEEEQAHLSNKGIKYKSDSSTMKSFGADFIEALDYIGFFDK
jgi:hypothetical protein